MRKHIKYTATRYEYAIQAADGRRAFTLWFRQRKPSLQAIHRCIVENLEAIRKATSAADITWNGDGTITAGDFVGKMTGETLLQARGYK